MTPATRPSPLSSSGSNRLGRDPKNTNYAGGNTSAKGTEVDPVTGEDVELVWVKGSGGDLGTLDRVRPGRAAAGPDARADPGLPRGRARGRDGRGVRLLPARQGRRGAVDRHRDARAGRLRARRPPPPRLRHRDRDGRRRRGADQGDLRRQGRLGALAPSGLPARPRHRRHQGGQPAGRRLHPRRARHHRVGRHQRGVGEEQPLDHRHRRGLHRRAQPSGAVRPGARRVRRPPRGRASRQGRRHRPHHPRAGLDRQADGRPLHRLRRGPRLPRRPPSTRAWPASAPRAPTTSCAPRSSPWSSTCPRPRRSRRRSRGSRSCTAPTARTTRATTTATPPPSRPRSAAPTR